MQFLIAVWLIGYLFTVGVFNSAAGRSSLFRDLKEGEQRNVRKFTYVLMVFVWPYCLGKVWHEIN